MNADMGAQRQPISRTLIDWARSKGRPPGVPKSVWYALRAARREQSARAEVERLVQVDTELRSHAFERAISVAVERTRLAESTRGGVYGTSESDIEIFLSHFHVFQSPKPLVRIGPGGDGTYLVPDDLEGIAACFSPGVSSVASFETHLASRGIRSYMCDGSVSSAPTDNPLFKFESKFLGLRSKPGWVTLDEWVKSEAPIGDLLLQMDIEGYEWPILASLEDDLLKRFRIVVVELHGLHLVHLAQAAPTILSGLDQLLAHHVIVHLHWNNNEFPTIYGDHVLAPVVELTLLRRDRFETLLPVKEFPDQFDTPNNFYLPDFKIPREWVWPRSSRGASEGLG